MVNDPISDFLTRLRNATLVSKSNVEIPHSKFKYELAKLFKDEGYVSDIEIKGEGAKRVIDLTIKFSEEGNSGSEGKDALSEKLLKEMNAKLESLKEFPGIEGVYFTSFVVQ